MYLSILGVHKQCLKVISYNSKNFAVGAHWSMLHKQEHRIASIRKQKYWPTDYMWHIFVLGGRKLTFTGQENRKWFISWNFSMSYSLIPQSLFDAIKCIPPLQKYIQLPCSTWHVSYIKDDIIQHSYLKVSVPQTVIYLDSIGDGIILISGPRAETYTHFI